MTDIKKSIWGEGEAGKAGAVAGEGPGGPDPRVIDIRELKQAGVEVTPPNGGNGFKGTHRSNGSNGGVAVTEPAGKATETGLSLKPTEPLAAPEPGPGPLVTQDQGLVVAEPASLVRQLPPYARRNRRTRRETIVTTLLALVGLAVLVPTALYVFTNPATWPGTLKPASQVDMNFARSGSIVSVAVKPGDHVKKGDILARQDDVAVNLTVSAAQATLAADQARLAALGAPVGSTPDPKIQAALDKAQKQLADAAAASSGSQQAAQLALTVAQQDLTTAQADQARDQGAFSTDCPQGPGGALAAGLPAGTPNCTSQGAQVTRDSEAVTRAQLHLQQQQQSAQQAQQSAANSQTLAQSQLSLAQASVAPAPGATTPQQASALQAQIAADEANVASVQAAAQDAVLAAPMDGVVAGVDAVPGDFAGPDGVRTYNRSVAPASQPFSLLAPSTSGAAQPQTSFLPVVQIYGTDGWLVVAQVGEHDALRAHPGQRADVRLDGVGKHRYPGQVTQVIGQPLRSAGDVVYNVVIKLDAVPSRVLPGMTASVLLHR